ncbi:MAG: carbohydrate ABC transporter permease [Fibrobacteres bacterium]|nr:carbohydrate ABC transporter permease [Fibrobacterota bacterium]
MEKMHSKIERVVLPKVSTVVLIIGALTFCLPFWWLLVNSFDEAANLGLKLPPILWFRKDHTGIANFVSAFNAIPILKYYFNTLLITAAVIVLQVFNCCFAGYAFAKGTFPGKKIIFMLFLATMMIPFQLYMIPLYLVMNETGLVNTLFAIILPGIHSAFGVFLATQYIKGLPDSIFEAARIEGCSEARIFFTIVLPLSKPVIATLSVLTALGCWNDFLWPYLVLLKESNFTITVGVSMFQQQNGGYMGNTLAVALLAIAPIVTLYIFLQRFIIKGITAGATKH